ncbi:conjugal transfer protein TraF [Vibrio coralliilyticus]|uniref:Conjugal transfer protein TraF n=1 Tax=Vibrio coralliilyticus TaxID=190893 RepID=A0AAP6ZVM7_9VIBR|nr:conjugal transfer protein TraF [Vibrio coralliilyticus]NOI31998.1 hypothetical protein [Vibrio coralliilyticus]NOJ25199.1 hypothetical protein [Vibrio coralliilyticus]
MKRLIMPVIIGLIIASPIHAQENTHTQKQTLSNEDGKANQYYTDGEKGWFWYEKLSQEEKEELLEKLKSEQSQTPQKETKPLSNKWFRENFQNYIDAAINNPFDREAMRNYLYLEKFMRDRANAFGLERQKAILAEPFLDATSSRPIANFGMKTMNVQATKNKDALLSQLGEKTGLYFFYLSGDTFSVLQSDLIALLNKEYGFSVIPVSLDGSAPPSALGAEYEIDSGQADALNIQVLPATYLYNPINNSMELVGQGMHSLTDLKTRIIHAALRGELIDQQQYQLTRPTGLYSNPNGYVSGSLSVPEDAPQEFVDLYNESQNK